MRPIGKEDIRPEAGWSIIRAPKTDRIIAGAVTEVKYDKQGDRVDLSIFEKRLPWVVENSHLIYRHGVSPYGVVPLGDFFAYKVDKNAGKAFVAAYVNEGNEVVDDIWKNEIQPLAHRAGFSIGGIVPPGGRNCTYKEGQRVCDITDAVIFEISWTPSPANDGATVTYVNQMAKGECVERSEKGLGAVAAAVLPSLLSGAGEKDKTVDVATVEEDEKREQKELLQKPCSPKVQECVDALLRDPDFKAEGFDSRTSRAWAICNAKFGKMVMSASAELASRVEQIYKHIRVPVDASVAVMGCGTCDDFATALVREGKSVARALLALENVINRGKDLVQKDEKEELRTMPETDQTPSEREEFEKRCKSLEDKIATLESALASLQKAVEASRKEIVPPVGVGEPPLKGVPTEAPDASAFELNQTTKGLTFPNEDAVVAFLVRKGYRIEGYEKVQTPSPKPTTGEPSGIRKSDAEPRKLTPEGSKVLRAVENMRKLYGGGA